MNPLSVVFIIIVIFIEGRKCFMTSNNILVRNANLHPPISLRTNLMKGSFSNIPSNQLPLYSASVNQNFHESEVIKQTVHTSNIFKNIWEFSRPHTMIGSGLSLLSVYAFATPIKLWFQSKFWKSYVFALIPSLLMNIYITGLNQLTDVEIDKINKPYLPIASGKLSFTQGVAIASISFAISMLFAIKSDKYLALTLLCGGFLGTVYSLPPLRLKRFPLLAALCILTVRGLFINAGFFLSSRVTVMNDNIPSFLSGIMNFPESAFVSLFFSLFGLIIALMKDVPDVSGDIAGKISSFSVRVGPKRMFWLSRSLLSLLLGITGSGVVFFSTKRSQSLTNFALKIFVGTALIFTSFDVRRRGNAVDANESHAVFDYYMYIWKIFYGCYFLLPFLTNNQ